MRFTFTPEQDAFRSELQDFLRGEGLPDDARTTGFDRSFSKKMSAKGYIGSAWPKEYGGQGLGPVEQMIYTEQMILHDAPRGYHFTAERQVGPSLIRHGTEAQKRDWLPRIVGGDVSFALGLSEPGAGSDLAAAATRAQRDGDEYIVNGQKIWTSGGHLADCIWLVVRTDPDAPKHRGISCLMVDLKSQGITIRPVYDLTGGHHFNEVFFEDVRVPVDRRVGEENRGWYILAEHLDFERSGIERLVDLDRLFQRVMKAAKEVAARGKLDDPLRWRLAELSTGLEVGRLLCYRTAYLQSIGQVPNYEASMAKVYGTEWSQRMMSVAMQLIGMDGTGHFDGTLAYDITQGYRQAVSRTIAGGTSEIQRNIIANRGLGLPRS
jgi:alkylation response protein AidB-like acyl-CoA dehydrogenase